MAPLDFPNVINLNGLNCGHFTRVVTSSHKKCIPQFTATPFYTVGLWVKIFLGQCASHDVAVWFGHCVTLVFIARAQDHLPVFIFFLLPKQHLTNEQKVHSNVILSRGKTLNKLIQTDLNHSKHIFGVKTLLMSVVEQRIHDITHISGNHLLRKHNNVL